MFNLGTKSGDQDADKKKTQNIQQTADQRLAETLSIKDSSKQDVKRSRENYAQSLRK